MTTQEAEIRVGGRVGQNSTSPSPLFLPPRPPLLHLLRHPNSTSDFFPPPPLVPSFRFLSSFQLTFSCTYLFLSSIFPSSSSTFSFSFTILSSSCVLHSTSPPPFILLHSIISLSFIPSSQLIFLPFIISLPSLFPHPRPPPLLPGLQYFLLHRSKGK